MASAEKAATNARPRSPRASKSSRPSSPTARRQQQQQQHDAPARRRAHSPTSSISAIDSIEPPAASPLVKTEHQPSSPDTMFMNPNASYSTPDLFDASHLEHDYGNDSSLNPKASKTAKASNATPLACVECRNRHLKCDGQPTCARCQAQGQACVYQKSRRGYRARDKKNNDNGTSSGPRDTTQPASSTSATFDASASEPAASTPLYSVPAPPPTTDPLLYHATDAHLPYYDPAEPLHAAATRSYDLHCLDQLFSQDLSPQLSSPDLFTPDLLYTAQHLSAAAPPTSSASPAVSSTARAMAALAATTTTTTAGSRTAHPSSQKLRELYYQYFHAGHPILPPSAYLQAHPEHAFADIVVAAVNYVGAAYVDRSQLAVWQRAADDALAARSHRRDGHTVQALLLLAVAQNVQDEAERAHAYLDRAIDVALEIGMQRDGFAAEQGRGDRVLEEGWRRTWWELYYLDALCAAVSQKAGFRLFEVEAGAGLPGEEADYDRCMPGPTHHLSDLEDDLFADTTTTYSSFTYLVTAARNFGGLLKLNESFLPNNYELVGQSDTALTSWLLNLPECKREPNDARTGEMDEVMFQAHFIVNAALIFLHRPRSRLIFTPVDDTTSCTPSRRIAVPNSSYSLHTAKAISAANRISSLVTLPCPSLLHHTPLFTCMLTLSAVVHLSAYVLSPSRDAMDSYKGMLGLTVGALRGLAGVWKISSTVLGQINAAAREVLDWKKNGWGPFQGKDGDGGMDGYGGNAGVEYVQQNGGKGIGAGERTLAPGMLEAGIMAGRTMLADAGRNGSVGSAQGSLTSHASSGGSGTHGNGSGYASVAEVNGTPQTGLYAGAPTNGVPNGGMGGMTAGGHLHGDYADMTPLSAHHVSLGGDLGAVPGGDEWLHGFAAGGYGGGQ